jgi:hypothetical protein
MTRTHSRLIAALVVYGGALLLTTLLVMTSSHGTSAPVASDHGTASSLQ